VSQRSYMQRGEGCEPNPNHNQVLAGMQLAKYKAQITMDNSQITKYSNYF
jgi:hypothetical protein